MKEKGDEKMVKEERGVGERLEGSWMDERRQTNK